MKKVHAFVLAGFVLFAGCYKRSAVKAPETGRNGPETDLSAPVLASPDPVPAAEAPAVGNDLPFEEITFGPVRFDFDSARLSDVASAIIERAATYRAGDTDRIFLVEGFTDAIGSIKYNERLGYRRANAVKRLLVRLGVPAGSVIVTSHGKLFPECPGSGADCYARNRRALITAR